MKKLLGFMLVVSMVLSAVTTSVMVLNAADMIFVDVKKAAWYYEEVKEESRLEIVSSGQYSYYNPDITEIIVIIKTIF